MPNNEFNRPKKAVQTKLTGITPEENTEKNDETNALKLHHAKKWRDFLAAKKPEQCIYRRFFASTCHQVNRAKMQSIAFPLRRIVVYKWGEPLFKCLSVTIC